MSNDRKLISDINTVLNQSGSYAGKFSSLQETLEGYESFPDVAIKHIVDVISQSNSDETTLQRLWTMLDYLSSVCPQKLLPLVESEDFLEKLSFLTYDERYRLSALSLIKYWSMTFESMGTAHPQLKTLIANLNDFEIELPEKIILVFCGHKSGDDDRPLNQMISESYQFIGPIGPVNKNQKRSGILIPSDNNIPDEARAGAEDDSSCEIMTYDEIVTYKTTKCHLGTACKNTPELDKRGGYRNESLMCDKYHINSDSRKPLYGKINKGDAATKLSYLAKKCPRGEKCKFQDCNHAHTYFEFMFHPINYKRYRCIPSDNAVCTAGKYCPYYHTLTEKILWNSVLETSFNIKRDSQEATDTKDVEFEELDLFGDSMPDLESCHEPQKARKHNLPKIIHYTEQLQPQNNQQPDEPSNYQNGSNNVQETKGRKFVHVKSVLKVPHEFIKPAEVGKYNLFDVISLPFGDAKRFENLKKVMGYEWSQPSEKYDTSRLYCSKSSHK